MSYVFRRWREGDKRPTMWSGRLPAETYVLLYEETQVGVAILGHAPNNVALIEIFEPFRGKGHGKVFIKKIEEEVKKKGYDCITAYPVTNEEFWLREGYEVEKVEGKRKLLKKKLQD